MYLASVEQQAEALNNLVTLSAPSTCVLQLCRHEVTCAGTGAAQVQTIIDMGTASDHAYFSEVAVKHGRTSGSLFFTDSKANCIRQWTSQGEHPFTNQPKQPSAAAQQAYQMHMLQPIS